MVLDDEVDEGNKMHLDECVSIRPTVKSHENKSVETDNDVHMVEDEVDEDNRTYLEKYVSIIDVDKDNHVDGSDIDANTSHNSDDDDYPDPEYKMFLQNLRVEGRSYFYSAIVSNQLVHIRYEQEEEEEKEEGEEEEDEDKDKDEEEKCFTWKDESGNLGTAESDSLKEQTGGSVDSQQSLETARIPSSHRRVHLDVSDAPKNDCNNELDIDVDEDYQIILNSGMLDDDSDGLVHRRTRNRRTRGIESHSERTHSPVESLESPENVRGPCNPKRLSKVSSVPKNNCNTEMDIDMDEDYQTFFNLFRIDDDSESWVPVGCELKGKSWNVRKNSQSSDQANDTLEVQSNYDEDYLLFLNSNPIIDGDLVYMRENNITDVEGGYNSSDSDLILLEPDQIGENTPFIPSKVFDLSCIDVENETNQRDGRQFPACDQSQFRRRLMKCLEKPYDQNEYELYLNEVHRQRNKDRHFETRQGVVKSYPTYGVNKSYLELYPDLEKAIDEFKEPHRVLFLLRGFIFWLKNLTYDHNGIFQPWRDEPCLEILRKL
ncbi:hypothetical protein RIF29_16719 [Crotalaria pallida]|uniref:Uncharacterized protein n=1 Tax=Crotalaria pallida TaxID=3830 RepID=A0AAN9FH18_CROPI